MDRIRDLDSCSLEATELRLGLPGTDSGLGQKPAAPAKGIKRALADISDAAECNSRSCCTEESCHEPAAPIAKAQVVGWPPVRSYRKHTLQARKEIAAPEAETSSSTTGLLVKVSMDGAPYLRKIDLCMYKGYKELRLALDNMFKSFSLNSDLHQISDYSVAYEDKDGDWMLAGDVPWQMFLSSCKRLRIMKGSEAKGL